MPDLWASIRSMAKKVLPVLVGPRTAVTLAGAGVVEPVLRMKAKIRSEGDICNLLVKAQAGVLWIDG
jgi:hypothetical protein